MFPRTSPELRVRGCSNAEYIAAATRSLHISGWWGEAPVVRRTRYGAVVTFTNCENVANDLAFGEVTQ